MKKLEKAILSEVREKYKKEYPKEVRTALRYVVERTRKDFYKNLKTLEKACGKDYVSIMSPYEYNDILNSAILRLIPFPFEITPPLNKYEVSFVHAKRSRVFALEIPVVDLVEYIFDGKDKKTADIYERFVESIRRLTANKEKFLSRIEPKLGRDWAEIFLRRVQNFIENEEAVFRAKKVSEIVDKTLKPRKPLVSDMADAVNILTLRLVLNDIAEKISREWSSNAKILDKPDFHGIHKELHPFNVNPVYVSPKSEYLIRIFEEAKKDLGLWEYTHIGMRGRAVVVLIPPSRVVRVTKDVAPHVIGKKGRFAKKYKIKVEVIDDKNRRRG